MIQGIRRCPGLCLSASGSAGRTGRPWLCGLHGDGRWRPETHIPSPRFLLLVYDLFVNSFSELLRMAPVIQLVLFIIQDIAILFNIIIIFLMFFNTFVFQAGLVNLLFHKFKGTIVLSAAYLVLSIAFHIWVMNLRWKNSTRFVWTDGLQALFVFQRLAAVLYCYFYKRTALHLGDPRFYQDSLWLRKEFAQVRS